MEKSLNLGNLSIDIFDFVKSPFDDKIEELESKIKELKTNCNLKDNIIKVQNEELLNYKQENKELREKLVFLKGTKIILQVSPN